MTTSVWKRVVTLRLKKFSKVSPPIMLHSESSSELTFENFVNNTSNSNTTESVMGWL